LSVDVKWINQSVRRSIISVASDFALTALSSIGGWLRYHKRSQAVGMLLGICMQFHQTGTYSRTVTQKSGLDEVKNRITEYCGVKFRHYMSYI
jgi:hypothetical protein